MTWINVKTADPGITKTENGRGYESRYVLVKMSDGNIVNARLEGSFPEHLFWYSPLFPVQLDNVIEWMDIPSDKLEK